jgi:hypothetical protein
MRHALAVLAVAIPLAASSTCIESAPNIVVASLVSADAVSRHLILHLERVIKGDAIPGAEVAMYFELPAGEAPAEEAPANPPQPIHLRGIFFLNPDPRGYTWATTLCVPVKLPEEAPPGSPGDTPEASVANEIASALRWRAQSGFAEDIWSLTDSLRALGTAAALPIDHQFVDDSSPFLRELGIAGLIAANEPEGVKLATDWTPRTPAASLVAESFQYYSNPDPSGVLALGKLVLRDPDPKAPDLVTRVLFALVGINTEETLPSFAALLDSKDENLQALAINGFCLFAPIPVPQPPCDSPDLPAVINYWKSWWTAHRPE